MGFVARQISLEFIVPDHPTFLDALQLKPWTEPPDLYVPDTETLFSSSRKTQSQPYTRNSITIYQ